MVDIENLTNISNSGQYPTLFNSEDIEAVKSIVEIYPDLFSVGMNQGAVSYTHLTLPTMIGV